MNRYHLPGVALALLVAAVSRGAEIAADQRQVAIGYERLETLALRIADAVEADDAARADQIRKAIGSARAGGLEQRFEKVVRLLERERYSAVRADQTQLAGQLEELLRLVMADPNEARLEEERQRLELLRREIRSALREQRSLRARAKRGESAKIAPRQERLASKIERLQEPARETDRASGRGSTPPTDAETKPGEPGGQSSEADPSIAGRLESSEEAMRRAGEKLGEGDDSAEEDQQQAQRELEAAEREAEERLRQLREEEQQRRLATLAERFRRMHEAEVALVSDTNSEVDRGGDAPGEQRARQIAAVRLADRQGEVGAAAQLALRVVRADGTSRVFDDALVQLIDDTRNVEQRLRAMRLDATTLGLEESVVGSLAELIAAVDQSLDELEQRRDSSGQSGQGGAAGENPLVSKIAELRMIRSIQARLLQQTEVWDAAIRTGEASPAEASERLMRLADEQNRLAEAAEAVGKAAP